MHISKAGKVGIIVGITGVAVTIMSIFLPCLILMPLDLILVPIFYHTNMLVLETCF